MLTNQQTQYLRFISGQESFPIVLTNPELSSSPFAHTVNSAIKTLDKLYASCKAFETSNYLNWEFNTPNNIISFLGERGSGKTSCMRTVGQLSKTAHPDEWLVLDEIDPSFFDNSHNILEIFIGSIYGVFNREMDKWKCLTCERQDALRDINDYFRKVKAALRYLKSDYAFGEDYETDELRHLNDGGRLRSLIFSLISKLLAYLNKKFLLISIDDLDLNVTCTYEMLEQIRKFLILPNVGILIAAKYNQLFDNISLMLSQHYKDIPHRVSKKDIDEMAERYLNKILPLSNRCEMPVVDSYTNAVMLIDDEEADANQIEERRISLRIPELIFKKTRFLFYNTAGMPSLVIPRNLRDLRMLVAMLLNMPDYSDSNRNNQLLFRNYFFNEWLGIIEPEFRPFVRGLLNEDDPSKINLFVIGNLYELFLKEVYPLDNLRAEVRVAKQENRNTRLSRLHELLFNILNPANSYWNVSVGDVVFVMNEVRKIHHSGKALALLFVITSFYSMKLYETYNFMTDATSEAGLESTTEKPASSPELKTGVRADIPLYFRLAGGALFTGTGDSFIPLSQNGKEYREKRKINGQFLMQEISKVVRECNEILIQGGKVSDNPHLLHRLQLCEFFMLCSRERIDMSRGSNRRLVNEPLYLQSLGFSVKNLIFDVTAPFLNTIYPNFAYSRFNPVFYSIASQVPDSILNLMILHGVDRGKDNKHWELMSKATIRNMEILEDFTAWIHHRRGVIRPGGRGMAQILADFFNQFEISGQADEMPTTGYCVKTYHKSGNAQQAANELSYYRIDYSIYSELGKFLDSLDKANLPVDATDEDKVALENLIALFNAIMAENDIFILQPEYDKRDVRAILYPLCGHSVVDMAIGQAPGSISVAELAQRLAEITIENRYDFSNRLPGQLQFYYNTDLIYQYDERIRKLEHDKHEIENEISNINEDITGYRNEIKSLWQDLSQCKKDIDNLNITQNEIAGELPAQRKNLEILMNRVDKHDFTTKAEFTRINKEIESVSRTINLLDGKMYSATANIESYNIRRSSLQDLISDRENNIKHLNTQITEHTLRINQIETESKRLKFNFENRKPV